MIRRILFWTHLSIGITAGIFIFVMSVTGVILGFERQINEWADRDFSSVPVAQGAQRQSLNDQLQAVRKAGLGNPTAIVVRNRSQASTQFTSGRGKAVYVDPYSGAILGNSSEATHDFFAGVERLHRALGAPLGSRTFGRWLAGVANLLFGLLIVIGIFIWMPRRWSWQAVRASTLFRRGLSGKPRDWNWHNVIGIWCAIPLLVIVLSGVVMSFNWANTLLFRLSGSTPPAARREGGNRQFQEQRGTPKDEPNYDVLMTAAKGLDPAWRTITLNMARGGRAPLQAMVDAGTGGQPQKRVQYLLDRNTGAVVKKTAFEDGSLGQRLRSFVRFGHTGEWGGLAGQTVAVLVSLGACVLVYTGLTLSIRRLSAMVKRKRAYAVTLNSV